LDGAVNKRTGTRKSLKIKTHSSFLDCSAGRPELAKNKQKSGELNRFAVGGFDRDGCNLRF
jgi:hypothetical protein